MQYVNNDMDELFRKAAEDYPLKTTLKDWDEVSPFVMNAAIPGSPAEKSKRKIAALLLIPFFFITFSLLLLLINHHPQRAASNNNLVIKPINNKINTHFIISVSNNVIPAKTPANTIKPGKQKQTAWLKTVVNATPVSETNKEENSGKEALLPRVHLPLYKTSRLLINDNSFLSATLSAKKPGMQIIAAATAPQLQQKNNRTGFYYGLEAGLQVNQVKGQGFTKPGPGAGLVAGFRINKKIAVETGITWSVKHFFTDGKYFDITKAGANMPPNMTVTNLSSSSSIFEVPVKFTYRLPGKRFPGWLVTAGISSYLLTSESNNYLAVINGQQQNMQGKYITHKGYFFAAAQLGVAYEYPVKKQIKLRIEPYIQIPLKGIGIGEVQVMTAGLHIGLLRHTHQ